MSGGSHHGRSFLRNRSVWQKVQVPILQVQEQSTVKTWRAGHAERGICKISHRFIKQAREEVVEALTEVPTIPDFPGTTEKDALRSPGDITVRQTCWRTWAPKPGAARSQTRNDDKRNTSDLLQ